MDRAWRWGYAEGSALHLAMLLGVAAAWRLSAGSLSAVSLPNRQSEIFYWAAILMCNTLGAALGDLLSDSSGLGFAGGAVVISAFFGYLGGSLCIYVIAPNCTFLDGICFDAASGCDDGRCFDYNAGSGGWYLARLGFLPFLVSRL